MAYEISALSRQDLGRPSRMSTVFPRVEGAMKKKTTTTKTRKTTTTMMTTTTMTTTTVALGAAAPDAADLAYKWVGIVGGALGSVAAVTAMVTFFWAVRDRRRVAKAAQATDEEAAVGGTTALAAVPRLRVASKQEAVAVPSPAALGEGRGAPQLDNLLESERRVWGRFAFW
ncbi:hypothetical protein GQ53DRAFT_759899 [Thozetella sp. PMI_491]|nr:hypothetical protein GQ53DRAFT_759899 [Thozetella sp. PMI_491]